MAMPIGDMKVMIPMDSAEEIGVRQVIDEEETKRVIEILQGEMSNMSQIGTGVITNMEKIKSGDACSSRSGRI